jgi:hypothetical protein
MMRDFARAASAALLLSTLAGASILQARMAQVTIDRNVVAAAERGELAEVRSL